MPTTKREWARHFASKGFPIFPVVENTKRARIKDWPNLATTDLAQIGAWWEEWPNDNIGFYTNEFIVIDVDPRKGGLESLNTLTMVEDFPKTARHRTQGDGAHIIYAAPDGRPLKGGNDKLGPGLDIKARGGYILLPGSEIDGRGYFAMNESLVNLAPPWLVERCNAARIKTDAAGKRIVEEDDLARELFEQWMLNNAPIAETGNIDNTTYKVGARGYDFGCSQPTVLDVLLEWNDTKCFPPQDIEDLERVVESAGRNRENAIGSAHPLAPGFEAVEIDETKKPAVTHEEQTQIAPKAKFYAVRADEGARNALTQRGEPLIKGVVHCRTMSVVVGAPGGGKTFLVLDWSYHIAKGISWAGKPVKQGAVVYLAAEAGGMIMSRLAALEAHYGPLGDAPLYIVPCSADFAHGPEDAKAILALIRDVEHQSGQKVELFVVDTLSRVIAGADENSSKDMGALIMNVDSLRQHAACHAMIIHHPNKAGASARGHGNVLGGTDTEMWVENKVLSFTKQRDMPEGADITFKLKPIQLGTDADGEPITSCVVRVATAGEAEPRMDLTGRLRDVWDTLDAALGDAGMTTFDMPFLRKNLSGHSVDIALPRTTIIRWMSELSESGYIKKAQRGQWVILNVQNVH